MPLFVHSSIGVRGLILVAVTVGLKGFVIPAFLVHAMREANIQHEVKPVVNFMSSLLLGAVGTGLAMVFSRTLPLAPNTRSSCSCRRRSRRFGPDS